MVNTAYNSPGHPLYGKATSPAVQSGFGGIQNRNATLAARFKAFSALPAAEQYTSQNNPNFKNGMSQQMYHASQGHGVSPEQQNEMNRQVGMRQKNPGFQYDLGFLNKSTSPSAAPPAPVLPASPVSTFPMQMQSGGGFWGNRDPLRPKWQQGPLTNMMGIQ